MKLPPQTHNRTAGKETIPACSDQVDIGSHTICQQTQKIRDTSIGQKMKIINKNIVRSLPGQLMAEKICKESGRCRICRTLIAI